jgi:hypothetical protein
MDESNLEVYDGVMVRRTHTLKTTHDYFEAGYVLNGYCVQCHKIRPVGIERVVKTASETEIPDLRIRCPECFNFLRLRAVVPAHGLDPWSGEQPEIDQGR